MSQLWGILWDMWQPRQEVCNEAPTADDIVIQWEAWQAAISELFTGQRSLPPLYTIYFVMSRQKLLKKSVTDLKAWLRVIRGARESLGTYASDLYSESGPHCSWLGGQGVYPEIETLHTWKMPMRRKMQIWLMANWTPQEEYYFRLSPNPKPQFSHNRKLVIRNATQF